MHIENRERAPLDLQSRVFKTVFEMLGSDISMPEVLLKPATRANLAPPRWVRRSTFDCIIALLPCLNSMTRGYFASRGTEFDGENSAARLTNVCRSPALQGPRPALT